MPNPKSPIGPPVYVHFAKQVIAQFFLGTLPGSSWNSVHCSPFIHWMVSDLDLSVSLEAELVGTV